MLSVIGKIFGSGDVIKHGMDLIDSMHTSTQEEIEAKTAARVDLLKAYAPFKLAQRVIAFSFTFTFLLCFFTAFVQVMVLGHPLPPELIDLMGQFFIGQAMLVILAFYFGGGAVEGIINSRKQK